MRPRSFALFSGCTLLFAYFAAFHAPAELSAWLHCFHSKSSRESSQVLGIFRVSLLTRENTTSTNALQSNAPAAMCAATACAIQDFAASRGWACRFCRWRCPLEEFRATCLQLPVQKIQSGWPQGRFHYPTSHWGIACACLLPGCFPMTDSLHPSVGVSIAHIFCRPPLVGLHVFTVRRCDGKKRRTAPCSQGASAAAPGALLVGMAADGVVIPGRPRGQPRPCQQQAICSV